MIIYFLFVAFPFFSYQTKTVSTEAAIFLGKYYFFAKFNNDVIFCAVDLEDQVSHHTKNLYSISATHIPSPYKSNIPVLIDNKIELKQVRSNGRNYKAKKYLKSHQIYSSNR